MIPLATVLLVAVGLLAGWGLNRRDLSPTKPVRVLRGDRWVPPGWVRVDPRDLDPEMDRRLNMGLPRDPADPYADTEETWYFEFEADK